MNLEEYGQMSKLENTHWYFRAKRTIVKKLLESSLDRNVPHRILDVGCGTGNILLMLREFGEAVGVDNSPVALDFCRSRELSQLHLTLPDGRLPFDDRSFDVACAFDLLEHIDEDLEFLRDIKRVIREDGKLFLIVPAHPRLWSEHDVALHHKRRYTRKQLLQLIEEAGMVCERMTFLNSLLFPVAYLYRIVTNKLTYGNQAKSEFFVPLPFFINWIFLKLFEMEALILPKWNLPFGLSLLAICKERQL